MRFRAIAVLLALLAALCPCGTASAAGRDSAAADLTGLCGFTVSSAAKDKGKLHDGRHSMAWTASAAKEQYVQITLPVGKPAAGVYVMWNAVPKGWALEAATDEGSWREVESNASMGFINAYIPLGRQYKKIRIVPDGDWKPSIAEIRVFGPGALPKDVQVWQPAPEKANLMVIPAHPDDEFIYFGGTLPTYAGQQHKHTVVVYMTSSPIIRKFEALDGLWAAGVREYPVFLPLANKYTSTVEEAELAWDGLDNTVGLLVEQLRKFRPDVIVTHDLNGEYGHGAHKLTALAVTKAVDKCADPSQYKSSAEDYGIWQVNKCYLHLYGSAKVRMDWREKLSAFNGKTALQIAQTAYDKHVSQHFRDRPIVDSGAYDNAKFGLYSSTVGKDVLKDDFFENVLPPVVITITAAPTPSPSPSSTAAPTPTPEPTDDSVAAMAAVRAGMRGNGDGELAIRVILAVGAIALLILLLAAYRRHELAQVKPVQRAILHGKLPKHELPAGACPPESQDPQG